MRKFLAALLGVTCISCAVAAAACTSEEPNYFTLTYSGQDGVSCDFGEILSGAEVKEGYTVSFTVSVDDGLEGELIVQLNDEAITPDANGVYSFVMEKESSVTVTGMRRTQTCSVLFEAGDSRVRYFDEEGNDITDVTGITRQGGDTISFTLKKSVYYVEEDFQVTAGSTILKPDANGVYTVEVRNANTVVSVSGLVQDEGFATRQGTGSGTAEDPYLISKPIDLYYIAALVEDSFYMGRFATAHYKLTADIDLQGEQLYIIGDYPSEDSVAMFMGEFDGNGHTISNYYIEDHIVDQETGEAVPLIYVGFFGVVSGSSSGVAASIHDLTLKDFTIEVDATDITDAGYFVGGLVGYGVGAEIKNCTVDGKITVYGNNDTFGYVGGLIGRQQSAYMSEDAYVYASVEGCVSKVDVVCSSGNFYAAGGISGITTSADEDANATILNSYSTGNVEGAMNTGGIAGLADSYSSIINCYSTGEIYASSNMNVVNGQSTYSHASAGGIVGYVGGDTVIANCFSVGEVNASATAGAAYRHSDGIAGRRDDAKMFVNSKDPVLYNNYSGKDVTANESFYKNTLGWTDGVWSFTGTYPELKSGAAAGGTLTVVLTGNEKISGGSSKAYTLTANATMSDLHRTDADGKAAVDRFLTADGGKRSYGYFFDAECTKAVPASYIPLGNVTLYVGFADYSEVAGTYYVVGGGDNNYITLGADGSLSYRRGALVYNTYYIYDGKTVTLQPSPASVVTLGEGEEATSSYVIAQANKGEALNFEYIFRTSADEEPASGSFTAVTAVEGFGYGVYYSQGASDYTFNLDGTGVKGNMSFSFTVSGNAITISLANGNTETGIKTESGLTINSVNYVKYDNFKGVWEKDATTHEVYTFDGKGGWSSEKFVYDEDGNKADRVTASGAYALAEGVLTLDNGYTVSFKDGNLAIYNGTYSVAYYRENSYVGEWKYFHVSEPVTVLLGGLNGEGYGEATVTYGSYDSMELTYEVIDYEGEINLYLWLDDGILGQLVFDSETQTLGGLMYSMRAEGVQGGATFCLFDEFSGLWISEEFGEVEFNGMGAYDIAGTATYSRTQGVIKINGRTAGAYRLDRTHLQGSFSYQGSSYTIIYNPATGKAEVKKGEDAATELVRADAMYGLMLVDQSGTRYSFDGGSALTAGGKLTVSGESSSAEYGYTPTDGGYAIAGEDGTTGSLVLDGSDYKLTLGTDAVKVLNVDNPFTGSWKMGGVNGGDIVISAINGKLQATGSYLGTAVTFTYDREGDYLSFTHSGVTLYIVALGTNSSELSVGVQPDTFGEHSVCVKTLDSYAGEYTAADGAKVVLDGLSGSVYGTGTASVRDAGGNLTATYVYRLNDFGELELTGSGTYLFAEAADGEYVKGSAKYELVAADWFYLRTGITDGEGNTYAFNGHNKVTVSSRGAADKVYGYEIVNVDEVSLVFTLKLTYGDETFDAEYDVATRIIKIAAED